MPNVNPDRQGSVDSSIYTNESNNNDTDLSERTLSIQTDDAYKFSRSIYPVGSSSPGPVYRDFLQSNQMVESSNASSQNMQKHVEDMSILSKNFTNTSEEVPFYNFMSLASQLQQETTKNFHLEHSNDLNTSFIHQETANSIDSCTQSSKSGAHQNHASAPQMYDRDSTVSSCEPVDAEVTAHGSARSFGLPRQVSDVESELSSIEPVALHFFKERYSKRIDLPKQVANTEHGLPSIELLDFHLLPEHGFDMKELFD
ncbi:predicted protein [Chaetoceros tenuissimus]|uniref:Uncharacterized protein n=1 Tax=Chaetoceros tenuissimus TaxID=426638 RepID=A0AAD3H3L5_9STRA|nr:predicted protein [Chaetoceros tenuissimus]